MGVRVAAFSANLADFDATRAMYKKVVEELGHPQNDAYEIVWAFLVIGLLHGRADLVVRLRYAVFYTDQGGVVA